MSIKLSTFYFFYFALLGVMAPYLGLYLEEQGFSLLEIAELASLLMVTKILAPNIWGYVADRTHRRLFLVRLGAALTLVSFALFAVAESFWHYALAIVLYSFFWNAVLPQFEVITLFNLGEQKERYSRIRSWGSLGFIVAVILFGWLFERMGIIWLVPVMFGLIFLIWFSSLPAFNEPAQATKHCARTRFTKQLLSQSVMIFFVVSFLLQVSHGAYYTYFSIYLEQLEYSKVSIGLFWSLGVLAEIILFLVMHVWFKASTVKLIMFISLVFTALRWMLIAELSHVIWVLVFAQVLHALSFGAMHAASIHFVHDNFSQANQGQAQAFYSSASFGAGGAVGAFLSGLLVSSFGYTAAFHASALVTLFACLVLVFMRDEKNQSEIG